MFPAVLIFNPAQAMAQASPIPAESRQLLVAVGQDWPEVSGEMRLYARPGAKARWKAVGPAFPVMFGRAGLAWGLGLHGQALDQGPVKSEGDGKAPAGVFDLGPVFAYDPRELGPVRMPVLQAGPDLMCVDKVDSPYYNTVVDIRQVGTEGLDNPETMRREDDLYRFGLVVKHNPTPVVPGAGSCIFIHVWRGPGSPTVGCTSMAMERVRELISWLDQAERPVLVQLPRDEYRKLRAAWGLPKL